MTVEQFRESCESWDDLLSFCREHEIYDYIDNIVSRDEMESDIADDAHDYIVENGLEDFVSMVDDIRSGYDYYRCHNTLEYEYLTDGDLQDQKEQIIAENPELFDAEEDEEEIEESDDGEPFSSGDGVPESDEDIAEPCDINEVVLEDFFSDCYSAFTAKQAKTASEAS